MQNTSHNLCIIAIFFKTTLKLVTKMQTRSSTLMQLEKLKLENQTLKKEKNIIEKCLCAIRKEKKELENNSEVIKKLRSVERERNFLDRIVCAYGGELQRIESEIKNCDVCKHHITPI